MSRINQKPWQLRIQNELNQMGFMENSYLPDIPVMFIDYNIEKEKLFFIASFLYDKYTCVIMLDFKGANYPFKEPQVKINGIYDYKNLLAVDETWTRRLGLEGCLCCSSILCRWSPQFKIIDILNEIHKNLSYKLRIRDIILSRSVTRQCFGFYLPIEEYL